MMLNKWHFPQAPACPSSAVWRGRVSGDTAPKDGSQTLLSEGDKTARADGSQNWVSLESLGTRIYSGHLRGVTEIRETRSGCILGKYNEWLILSRCWVVYLLIDYFPIICNTWHQSPPVPGSHNVARNKETGWSLHQPGLDVSLQPEALLRKTLVTRQPRGHM